MAEKLRLERHPIADGMFIIAAGVIETDTIDDLAAACSRHLGGRIDLDLRAVTRVDDAGVEFLLDLADHLELNLSGAPEHVAQALSATRGRPIG